MKRYLASIFVLVVVSMMFGSWMACADKAIQPIAEATIDTVYLPLGPIHSYYYLRCSENPESPLFWMRLESVYPRDSLEFKYLEFVVEVGDCHPRLFLEPAPPPEG